MHGGSIVFSTMDPNLYPRVPPPKDVDPPRQRIDVAVSAPLSPLPFRIYANLPDSVNVVGDGKSNVPDGQRNNLGVWDVLKRTMRASL